MFTLANFFCHLAAINRERQEIALPTSTTTEAEMTTDTVSDLSSSMNALAALDAAYLAVSRGLDGESVAALAHLRDADDLLQQTILALAAGQDVADAGVVERFRWSIMKLVEFNDMLPVRVRGNLSRDCFRKGAARGPGRWPECERTVDRFGRVRRARGAV